MMCRIFCCLFLFTIAITGSDGTSVHDINPDRLETVTIYARENSTEKCQERIQKLLKDPKLSEVIIPKKYTTCVQDVQVAYDGVFTLEGVVLRHRLHLDKGYRLRCPPRRSENEHEISVSARTKAKKYPPGWRGMQVYLCEKPERISKLLDDSRVLGLFRVQDRHSCEAKLLIEKDNVKKVQTVARESRLQWIVRETGEKSKWVTELTPEEKENRIHNITVSHWNYRDMTQEDCDQKMNQFFADPIIKDRILKFREDKWENWCSTALTIRNKDYSRFSAIARKYGGLEVQSSGLQITDRELIKEWKKRKESNLTNDFDFEVKSHSIKIELNN